MFLVDWLQANLLMVFTTLCLIGIPAIIIYTAFRKHQGAEADKEAYDRMKAGEK